MYEAASKSWFSKMYTDFLLGLKTAIWEIVPVSSSIHRARISAFTSGLKKRSKVATEPKLTAKVTGSISRSSTKLTRVATNPEGDGSHLLLSS